jgi:CheY-like chemotaxis protein
MIGIRNSTLASNGKTSAPCKSEVRPRVLVVDDEAAIADTITKILSLSGYAAMAEYDGNGALRTAQSAPPELLITDVIMPGMSGIELAITMKRNYPACKILLFSGHATTADLLEAANRSGHHFKLVNKPVPPQQLLAIVAEQLTSDGSERPAALPQA